jgi:hypothetical protein
MFLLRAICRIHPFDKLRAGSPPTRVARVQGWGIPALVGTPFFTDFLQLLEAFQPHSFQKAECRRVLGARMVKVICP